MKYLLIFNSLIATANALYCECSTDDCWTDTCYVAKGAGTCYTTERELFFGKGVPARKIVTGCHIFRSDPTLCDQKNVIISSGKGFYLMSSTECCDDEDICNDNILTTLPKFSEVIKTLSSKELACPSCFVLNAKKCVARQMNCSETQNKCFNISGTLASKDSAEKPFIAKGCTVESTILKNKATFTFGHKYYTFETVSVSDAKKGEKEDSGCRSQISGGLSFAILLPSVLSFLLDRTPY